MPQKFFYALTVLQTMPMDKLDELAERVLGSDRRETYPKWVERTRTIEFRKRVRDLLDALEAWTLGIEEMNEKHYEVDIREIVSLI